MAGRSTRALLAAARRDTSAESETKRVALGRVRLRSLARVAFSMGWFASFWPSLIVSVILVWVLHAIWNTMNGWSPWTPWSPGTRILGAELPTPEFAPREALRVDGLYRALEPIGQHPFIAMVLCTLLLTLVGGLLFSLAITSIGMIYNRFIGLIGGVEFELIERPARATPRARRGREAETEEWDEAKLRW
jgi:uncharacterized protein (DUF2062 family)